MSHSSSQPKQLPVVYEENDPYRVLKKSPRMQDSDSSEVDIIHSRTASDSSTSKLYQPVEYDDPYRKHKAFNTTRERANSYLPYSHHRRDSNQPPASSMYIEEYIPPSTSLGVGSMLQDNFIDQIHASSIVKHQDPNKLEELPKKKRRKKGTICGLGYRTVGLILLLLLIVVVIIWYFVWPRVPTLSVSSVNDNADIKVITNSTKKSISTQWNVSLSADNSANWVPTRLNSIDLAIYDAKTLVPFGSGSLGVMMLAPRKKSTISIPMTIYYATDSLNDTTFQDLYNACGVQISSNVPSENRQDVLNVTFHATFHISGIVWNPSRDINVHSLSCPTS
ncbi:hypothetical protein G6F37_006465 [Rhizopus arrhizus]|nr:hypothetical protein G6F38_008388 [Rhizopus arrhizus]KAG1157698.1 hypothetical protein G6F37_006465 [Rhizopus arrhizus]